jgi:hypothetical protein
MKNKYKRKNLYQQKAGINFKLNNSILFMANNCTQQLPSNFNKPGLSQINLENG